LISRHAFGCNGDGDIANNRRHPQSLSLPP